MSENNIPQVKTAHLDPDSSIQSPTQTRIKSNPRSKTINFLKSCLVIALIFTPIVAILAVLGLAAANAGRNNIFSSLSAYLPAERLPLFGLLSKDDNEFLSDSLLAELNPNLIKNIKGREQKVYITINSSFQDSKGQNYDADFIINGNAAVNAESDKSKADLNIAGNINAGIVSVDLGREAIKGQLLVPDKSSAYLFFDISNSLINLNPKAFSNPLFNGKSINDLKGKYIKADIQDLIDQFTKTSTPNTGKISDPERIQQATNKLEQAIEDDAIDIYRTSIGDIGKWMTIQSDKRQIVNGRSTIVLHSVIKEDKVADQIIELKNKLPDLIAKHQNDFLTFCKEVSLEPEKCSIDPNKTTAPTENEKNKIRRQVSSFFENFSVHDLTFYIDPKDNTVLKSEGVLTLKDKGLQTYSSLLKDYNLTKTDIHITIEEVSRGRDVSVMIPPSSINFKDLVKK